jgi:hypothetical protein
MKRRWIILVGVVLVAAGFGGWLLRGSGDSAQKTLEETRRTLRQQGFKIELSEFDFSTSPELRVRAGVLTNASWAMAYPRRAGQQDVEVARRAVLVSDQPELMAAVGQSAARVSWQQARLEPRAFPWPGVATAPDDLWPELRETMDVNRGLLDAACQAALSGPIRFELVARHGSAMVLPHLAGLKNLTQTLGRRTALELHDQNRDAAWTNLLASTRLVTAWDPEPTEISYLVRFTCAAIAYSITWEALQADGWSDDRLAGLQGEWESVDFFKSLPETEAFARASHVATCQLERQQPLGPAPALKEIFRSPLYGWSRFVEYWRELRYRHHGSYEDEKGLLLFHRDRELQLRRAVQCPTWSEMQQFPAATNQTAFQSKHRSRMQAMLNVRTMSMAFQRGGQGFLGRAAEAEARRRLIITAIALERYRGRHGAYPHTLAALEPELLKHPPIDFMDGQPLRYRPTEDGRFVLYSVGLDCVDNGGEMPRRGRPGRPYESPGPEDWTLPQQAADLVWPRPASDAEVQAQQAEVEHQIQLQLAAIEERRAEGQALTEAKRQATVEKLLAQAQGGKSAPQSAREPAFQGRPLSKRLRNETTTGTNSPTLDELLTVRQITTGDEPGLVTFEVPVSYEAATSLGRIHLVVDGELDAASIHEDGERQTCTRATNGNCLLAWTTTYDPPGRHAIQVEFIGTKDEDKEDTALKVKGPVALFVSTNLCQFDSAYDHFDARGATLYAELPESNGVYAIELQSPAGDHLKTLTGSTSNGVINVHWDLIDDRGRRNTNEEFGSIFHVTLPGSGRSQTLKGP